MVAAQDPGTIELLRRRGKPHKPYILYWNEEPMDLASHRPKEIMTESKARKAEKENKDKQPPLRA
eukprot:6210392-Pleurochrysis_carterae.AAC.1